MKKYTYFPLIMLISSFFCPIMADPVITFFFKPQPDVEKITTKLKKPGKAAKHSIHRIIEHIPIAGIYVTYSGYVTASDISGEVRFPRKHRDDAITIIVTSDMEPISLFGNTIQHWNLLPDVPAQMYTLQEIYNPDDQSYAWQTQKVDIPENNRIPLTAMVILAKPKNIVIPSETVKTNKTANLTLPPIYVKKGINLMSQDMHMLIFRHLFRPVEEKIKQTPLQQSSLLLN